MYQCLQYRVVGAQQYWLKRRQLSEQKRDIGMWMQNHQQHDHSLLHVMSSTTKTSSLDMIPTFLLKESIDQLLPFVTAMAIASLQEGHFAASQKFAIIMPVLKRTIA